MKSNSWIVTRKSNNEVVGEFFDYNIVLKFNTEKVIVETSYEYLTRINSEIKTK